MFRKKKTQTENKPKDSLESMPRFHFKRSRPVKRNEKHQSTKRSKAPFFLMSLAAVVMLVAFISIIVFFLSMYFPQYHHSVIVLPYTSNDDVSQLRKDLSDVGLQTDSITQASMDATLFVQIKDGPKVYFSPQEDLKNQVSSLQLIISRLTIEKKNPTVVDFRYNKPIVKF